MGIAETRVLHFSPSVPSSYGDGTDDRVNGGIEKGKMR